MNKRIIQLCFGDGYAGSHKFALLSSKGFIQLGHEVRLFVSSGSLTEKRALEAGIPVEAFRPPEGTDETYTLLREKVGAFKPSFIIAHHSTDRKHLLRLKRETGSGFYAVSFRNITVRSFPLISAIKYNFCVDLNIACGQAVKKSLVYRGVFPSKIRVVPNGIELPPEHLPPVDRTALGIKPGEMIVGISAWFHAKRKGFDVLFKALSGGLARPVRILILGTLPEHKQAILALAKKCGLNPELIVFGGYIENIFPYYRAMDIFTLPSRAEGLSLSLMEAMASGAPCIASDIQANAELIRSGVTGLLFRSGNPEALRTCVNLLLSDRVLKYKIVSAGRTYARENFSIERITEVFDRTLTELADKK